MLQIANSKRLGRGPSSGFTGEVGVKGSSGNFKNMLSKRRHACLTYTHIRFIGLVYVEG